MAAVSVAPAESQFGSSRWGQAAALLLLGLGIPICGTGLILFVQGTTYDDPGGVAMGYGILAVIIGVVIAAIGVLHMFTGLFVWRHQTWARILGIVICVVGIWLALMTLPTAFNLVRTSTADGQQISERLNIGAIVIGLSVVSYVLIVAGLVLGARHFRRQP